MTLIGINKQGPPPRDHSKPLEKGSPEWDERFGMMGKNKKNDEDALQKNAVSWFGKQYPHLVKLFFMINNKGATKMNVTESGKVFSARGNKNKAMGLISGIADTGLMIPNDRYHGFLPEFKNPSGSGRQSDNQKHWQILVEVMGYKYGIYDRLDSFQSDMTTYMATVNPELIAQIRILESQFQMEQSVKAQKKI